MDVNRNGQADGSAEHADSRLSVKAMFRGRRTHQRIKNQQPDAVSRAIAFDASFSVRKHVRATV